MSTFRLGLYKLPAAEVVLVQTLLRLYGGGVAGAHWTLADRPPWDALLVDATGAEPADSGYAGMAAAVLRITRMGEAGRPDTIERPIRPDKLLRWLDQRHPAMPAVASPPADEGVSTADAFSDVRYRLRRWPPASVLRNDARRVRLATLLSKRAFNAVELAAMSQQPAGDCHAFLRLLRGTGLVEVVASARPHASTSNPTSSPAIAHKPARGFASGLIGGLRRRLGL